MAGRSRRIAAFVAGFAGVIGLAIVSGCGEQKHESPKAATETPKDEQTAPKSSVENPVDKPPTVAVVTHSPDSPSASAIPAQPPDVAVLAVLEGMRTNHPEALWDFLPQSMQNHLNEAVREIGRSADADVWNRAAGLLKKVLAIFETKKAFILESPFWKTAEKVDVKQIEAHWEDIVGVLGSIVNSELSDVERLKEFEGRKFLADAGAKFLTHVQGLSSTLKNNSLADLKDVKVTVKSQSGSDAVITIEAPGQSPADHEFTVIEGKWCPKSWVESLPRLAQLKDGIQQVLTSERIVKQKESIMQELDQIETGIDQLLETKTAQEFNDLIAQRVIPYLLVRSAPLRSAVGAPSVSPAPSTGEAGTVTVIVTPKLNEKTAEGLVEKLAALSDNTGQSVVFGPNANEGGHEFTVTPVGDPEAFSKKIAFGSVVSVDKAKRTVTVKFSETGDSKPESK